MFCIQFIDFKSTIRKRLFLVARCDGQPIIWPSPTHAQPDAKGRAPHGLKPWRTAAQCIDWSIPCPSIFEGSKPLADATCRRIAKGIMRYVVEAAQPFIVSLTHQGGERVEELSVPFRTITGANRGEKALVSAFLAKHYTGVVGSDLADPMGTVTSADHHSLVAAHLVHMGLLGRALGEHEGIGHHLQQAVAQDGPQHLGGAHAAVDVDRAGLDGLRRGRGRLQLARHVVQ